METFSFLSAIIAGFLAVIIMNIFIFLFTTLTRTNVQLFALLGTLVTKEVDKHQKLGRSKRTRWTGVAIYYSFGILTALLYAALWHFQIGKPQVIDAFILGFFTGIIALFVLHFFLKRHPYLKVRLADYFSTLLIGSIIYAINFLYFYVLFKAS